MSHGVRCERSGSKRCRCECGGSLHGDQATPIDLGDKKASHNDGGSEPTDQEPKITNHPFRPHPLQPEVCGFQRRDGWACGASRADHTNPSSP